MWKHLILGESTRPSSRNSRHFIINLLWIAFSENFIATAKRIQNGEEVTFDVPIEGDIRQKVSIEHEHGVNTNVMKKVNFFQGDACALSEYADNNPGLGTFDGVILANLLCRLPDPVACLNAMPKVVNKGGVLLIVTPFSWLEGASKQLFFSQLIGAAISHSFFSHHRVYS